MLSRFGVLDRRLLNCEQCSARSAVQKKRGERTLQQERGCGFQPQIYGGELWNPERFMEEYGAQYASNAPYMHANAGNVHSSTGWLWPWCPRWFVEFAPVEVFEEAASVLEILEWYEAGQLQMYTSGTLSAGVVSLINSTKRLIDRLRNDEEKRLYEEAQRKAREGGR